MKQSMTSSGMPAFKNHGFSRVPNVSKPRSTFNTSAPYKTTISAGLWIPVFLREILPGDTFKVIASMFARLLSPLSVPIMDNLYLDWIAIYGPNRILWEHFINQMGETPTGPTESIDYLTPHISPWAGGVTIGTLAHYFGIPLGTGDSADAVPNELNALPFRMYNLFIAQWVVAQNVVDSPTLNFDDGPDGILDYPLAHRMKRPDYLTSCQPATQKGNPVQLPLGTSAPVNIPAGSVPANFTGHSSLPVGPGLFLDSVTDQNNNFSALQTDAVGTAVNGAGGNFSPYNYLAIYNSVDMPGSVTGIYADLSMAAGATINEFRMSVVTQQFLELDERGGTRFPEFLHNHFGVQSSDARLQRIEFISAGTIPIMTHVVPQTTPIISGSTPQANLSAFTSAAGSCQFNHSFEEHGWLMVLVEIRADVTYTQGLQKMWSRKTRFDYYDPLFANIGEQPVLNKEIYHQETSVDDEPFGYQEYAAEYRFGWGLVTGLMDPNASGNIKQYNLALQFGSLPGLNETFLDDTPPIAQVSAVESQDVFIFDSFWNVQATRVMPMFSIPGLTRI